MSFHINIIVRQSIQALGGLFMIFSLNPKLALISLAGLLLSSAISALNGSFSRWLSEQVQDELAQSNAVAEQSLSLVRLLYEAPQRTFRNLSTNLMLKRCTNFTIRCTDQYLKFQLRKTGFEFCPLTRD